MGEAKTRSAARKVQLASASLVIRPASTNQNASDNAAPIAIGAKKTYGNTGVTLLIKF